MKNILVATLGGPKATECHLNNGMMNLDKVLSYWIILYTALLTGFMCQINAWYLMMQRHMILKEYLNVFVERFKGEGRAEVGPMALTSVVRGICKRRLKPDELLYNLTSKLTDKH